LTPEIYIKGIEFSMPFSYKERGFFGKVYDFANFLSGIAALELYLCLNE
jgi:hypothetical protein